ncbi:hypothetical protein GCM10011490_01550 [Pseudoclavibacter endophyticus]|uniref:Arylamine N-acetyltransferase n=1 Tax=Pseudoclavibacter endophyticus TaxID=1778590 RepID=A0A6H9WTQ9_9MICO|nr:arylamine N-acetyltransferase [Pseudoclavibacter endophyticus]KAB1650297.1 arylamine N-acetyltransferase [Pseudoclavibacter endophyticus]GGA55372.1 hypothetical protein GCM10011490_01550 [Pseudoclavibacter endophyticus]
MTQRTHAAESEVPADAVERARLRTGYARRLGLSAEAEAALRRGEHAAFEDLVAAHVAAIPFENARVIRGARIRTDALGAVRRIVDDGAGGVCYELNGALAWLLGEIGLCPRLWAAEVRRGDPPPRGSDSSEERWGIPAGHGCLEVPRPGGALLVDVGFGGEGIVGRMVGAGHRVTSPTGRLYRVSGPVPGLEAFAPGAAWHSTSPDSRFTGSLVVSVTGRDATRTLVGSPGPGRIRGGGGGDRAGAGGVQGDGIGSRAFVFSSLVTSRGGDREERRLTREQAARFARTELGFAEELPSHAVSADASSSAPEPGPVHLHG